MMVSFIGEYYSKIDDKGRLVIPSAFRAAMSPESAMRFVIRKDLFAPCIEMYSYEDWQKQAAKIKDSLDLTFNRKHATFWREYMRDSYTVEPDAKFGRISVSRKLLDSISVNKEVVFSGNDFKIEIWAKETYEASRLSQDEFIAIAESLSQK